MEIEFLKLNLQNLVNTPFVVIHILSQIDYKFEFRKIQFEPHLNLLDYIQFTSGPSLRFEFKILLNEISEIMRLNNYLTKKTY